MNSKTGSNFFMPHTKKIIVEVKKENLSTYILISNVIAKVVD
jgi:hypothetical protein